MEMTINDLIKDLQNLKTSLRELPVKIRAENGLLFEPKAKHKTLLDEPKQMILTYK